MSSRLFERRPPPHSPPLFFASPQDDINSTHPMCHKCVVPNSCFAVIFEERTYERFTSTNFLCAYYKPKRASGVKNFRWVKACREWLIAPKEAHMCLYCQKPRESESVKVYSFFSPLFFYIIIWLSCSYRCCVLSDVHWTTSEIITPQTNQK